MKSRFLAFGSLALACILAAGGGAYLAVRHNSAANGYATVVDSSSPATPAPVAHGTPAAIVTMPPAPTDSIATAAPPARFQPPARTSESPATPARERDKPSRRTVRTEAPKSQPAGDGEQPAAGSPLDTRPAAQSVPELAQQPQAGNAPQSVTQAPPEPQREWVEVTVPAESVLGLQIQTSVSSETARLEDRVEARITRDIRIDDRVAIPAGTQAVGSVVQVERGGKVKERAHFAIRFNSLVLPDGARLQLTAEAVHREGPSPSNKAARNIGGATIGGAILGAILGGGKGAAIGGAIGAGGGTAATMASDREPATLPAGSIVNIRLMQPVTVTLER